MTLTITSDYSSRETVINPCIKARRIQGEHRATLAWDKQQNREAVGQKLQLVHIQQSWPNQLHWERAGAHCQAN